MPNYNDAQGVADLLSQFDFNIISEGPGDFSTQHRKYTCEFSKPGIESFTTTYQSNPDVHGQPTATDVFAALASDALAVDGRHIDDFADEMGFEKPSQAIRAYESCRKLPRKPCPSRARWRRPVALPPRWPITETIQIAGRTPARKEDCDMKGMLIPTNGNPVEIDIKVDETGSTLHDLQRLVGGNIEPFDVIFGEGISLYVNEEGLFTCPPNRAVYATKGMEEAGYLSMMVSMMDYGSPVKEGELYSILCGDLVAVGFDFETGENRDLSADEMSRVADYFTEVSKPGSGIEEVIAIRTGQRREEARSEDGRVTLKGEAQASRAASEKLAEGRDTGSPALDDHSIV